MTTGGVQCPGVRIMHRDEGSRLQRCLGVDHRSVDVAETDLEQHGIGIWQLAICGEQGPGGVDHCVLRLRFGASTDRFEDRSVVDQIARLGHREDEFGQVIEGRLGLSECGFGDGAPESCRWIVG